MLRHDAMTSVSVAVSSARSFALRIGSGDFHPCLGRELLDGVRERHPMVGEEADHVAMRAAAEAMVEPFRRITLKQAVFSL